MLARIRKAMDEREGGFTLIELLVVIIIIGILAAIAIPVFLNQRKKATEAGMKSDLRSVANEMETYYVDNQLYITSTGGASGANVTISAVPVKLSDPGTTVTSALISSGNAYCIKAVNTKVSNTWYYVSDGGGLTRTSATGCP